MSAMRLRQLLAGIATSSPLPDIAVSALTLDSRAVTAGAGFVALRGAQQHGVVYAAEAARRGAVVILYETPASAPELPVPVVAVPELRAHLGAIADRFHGSPSRGMRVIGVTGTNGKTSAVQLLTQALNDFGLCVGSIGTLGTGLHGSVQAGERTTPDVISTHAALARMRAQGASHVTMEVSSHALDQGRVDTVAFDIAVFTNLTRDHLDYHGDMGAYGAAKARLFDWPTLAAAVINADDAFGRELLARPSTAARVLSYSASGASADLTAANIQTSAAGIVFDMRTPWGDARIASSLLGRFNVANLLAVAATLSALEFSLDRIATALALLRPVAGRMNRLGGDARLPLVVVDYAHTPDALEQTLSNLRAHTTGRLICVFGCGGDRDRGKRPQMGAIAERLADAVIVTDDNPRSEDADVIVADIVAGLQQPQRATIERDRARAIVRAIADAHAGDTVLIAGKGHETYQEIAGRKFAFDDTRQAQLALEARA